ncbi:MAG: hypothetical protein FWE25_01960 [Lachnospiraceae bacterium]|nr:hypothetical protein [Lachnospiraceae bacterium]
MILENAEKQIIMTEMKKNQYSLLGNISSDSEIDLYIKGNENGDCCLVATCDAGVMAWICILPVEECLDKTVPELVASAFPMLEGQKVGTMIMDYLFELLSGATPQIRLPETQVSNPVVGIYKNLGYEVVDGKIGRRKKYKKYLMMRKVS